MTSLADVWEALAGTIRTWLPTYLRERERLTGRPYASLPAIRGWRIFAQELDAFPADQLPLCVIVSGGLADTPTNISGTLAGRVEAAIAIVVTSRSVSETLTLAADYGAALRTCLAQHRSLGGVVAGLRVLDERYDSLDATDQRTLAAAELVVSVRVDDLATPDAGPSLPFPEPAPTPDPGGPVLGTVATTDLDVERTP